MKNVVNTILAAMVGVPQDEAALRAAFIIAEKIGARVAAAVVRPSPEDMAFMMIGGYTDPALKGIANQLDHRFKKDKEAARDIYHGVRESFSGVKASFETLEGREGEVIATRGKFADLIVLPHPAHLERSRYLDVVETIIFTSGRPVLLVPPKFDLDKLFKHAALIWRCDAECSRALLMAQPLMRLADKVTLMEMDGDIPDGGSAEQAAGYLRSYGVEPAIDRTVADDFIPGEDVYAWAHEHETSLLIVGAIAHSRIREFLHTSLTRHSLRNPDFPILLVA